MPAHRSQLALPWGLTAELTGSDLIVLRGLIFKAVLVETDVLDTRDAGRFIRELAAASTCSFAVKAASLVPEFWIRKRRRVNA